MIRSALAALVLGHTAASGQVDCPTAGTVLAETKISQTVGGFGGVLDAYDSFGRGVCGIGDLDGDGVCDLAVGAPGDDDGGIDYGAAWILFLNADGTVRAEQKISATTGGFGIGLNDFNRFGAAIAPLGDLDGDGVLDLAVGAYGDGLGVGGGLRRGAVWVLFLRVDGTVKKKQKITDGVGGFSGDLDTGDYFGAGVAVLGDLDGDGVPEIAVGAPGDDDGAYLAGAVWVLFLKHDGTVKSHQKISSTEGGFGTGLGKYDGLGIAVAPLGDLDGDGTPDLAVGSGIWNGEGAVWVLFLNPDGTVRAKQKIDDEEGGFGGELYPNSMFGGAIALLGDIDGDGLPDLAVGDHADDDAGDPGKGGSNRGAVWILFLDTDGKVKHEQKISDTTGGFGGDLADGDVLGRGVHCLGDLQGDGFSELAVGATGDDDGAGAVWILSLDTCGSCLADCNGDGNVNIFDFLCFQGLVTSGDPKADCNNDGVINIFDFLCFQGLVSQGCG
jgi:hypothetical protein